MKTEDRSAVGDTNGIQFRLAQLMRLSGLNLLIRRTVARRRASILHYHDPEPTVFAAHMGFLRSNYNLVELSDLVAALESGQWDALPDRTVVITIDDGHKGNHALLPTLMGLPARPTLYACSQIVGTRRGYWPEGVEDRERLKRLPHAERVRILESRGFRLDADLPDGDRRSLSTEELGELLPFIELGSHTRFHPILPTCDDALAEEEIAVSKAEIESLSGTECSHFCFPNGDYGERDISLVREAGYRSARMIEPGWVGSGTDPFHLKVLGVSDSASVAQLAADLSGLGFAKSLLRRLLKTLRPA